MYTRCIAGIMNKNYIFLYVSITAIFVGIIWREETTSQT
jgi:hypothetical protein